MAKAMPTESVLAMMGADSLAAEAPWPEPSLASNDKLEDSVALATMAAEVSAEFWVTALTVATNGVAACTAVANSMVLALVCSAGADRLDCGSGAGVSERAKVLICALACAVACALSVALPITPIVLATGLEAALVSMGAKAK